MGLLELFLAASAYDHKEDEGKKVHSHQNVACNAAAHRLGDVTCRNFRVLVM